MPSRAASPPHSEVILLGGAVIGALVALLSSYPGAVAQVQDGPAVIIGVMATALAARWAAACAGPGRAGGAGLCECRSLRRRRGVLWAGRFRLGGLMRFIPFPVIGGFLAGSGLLILLSTVPVLTGLSHSKLDLRPAARAVPVARWVPGLAFGLLLLVILRRFPHPLLVPVPLLGAVVLYHVGLLAAGVHIGEAQAAGLLLGPFPENNGLSLPAWRRLPPEGWSYLVSQAPTFAAIILVSVVALLLNASGLELATRGDFDINRELRGAGIANMASGLLGGAVGFHALSASLLGFRMGANSRLIGLTAAAMCVAALLAGTSLLALHAPARSWAGCCFPWAPAC